MRCLKWRSCIGKSIRFYSFQVLHFRNVFPLYLVNEWWVYGVCIWCIYVKMETRVTRKHIKYPFHMLCVFEQNTKILLSSLYYIWIGRVYTQKICRFRRTSQKQLLLLLPLEWFKFMCVPMLESFEVYKVYGKFVARLTKVILIRMCFISCRGNGKNSVRSSIHNSETN